MPKLVAYATLMWDNALATYRGEKVDVEGLRRAFVGESTRRWGTPDHPLPADRPRGGGRLRGRAVPHPLP